MFLIFWKSEPQRSYKHGSYRKKWILSMFLIFWKSEPQRSYKHSSYKKIKRVVCMCVCVCVCPVHFLVDLHRPIVRFLRLIIYLIWGISSVRSFTSIRSFVSFACSFGSQNGVNCSAHRGVIPSQSWRPLWRHSATIAASDFGGEKTILEHLVNRSPWRRWQTETEENAHRNIYV